MIEPPEVIAAPGMDVGTRVERDAVTFTVWAPRQQSLALRLDEDEMPMEPCADGYFSLRVAGARAGQRYFFRLSQGLRPDPVSRFQPEGPFGPSMIVDPSSFPWTDGDWTGAPPRHRQVVYEMHIGTFTSRGTWGAARTHLQRLADLGVTTLEIMPIAEFAGRFGWGYDGVCLFAPYHEYGTPDDLRLFINDAHRFGLAVMLDVVYNHLGPSGNVLNDYSDWYFAPHETEWGRGFNVDGPHSSAVRQFMRANVRQWIQDYRFDGLRFDATQSIRDRSPEYIVNELTRYARETARPRTLFVVAENEPQDVALLNGDDQERGGIDALWSEDWHHAAYVALTGQSEAYCTDYDGTANEFASMARWGFLYQGQWYSWQQQRRGSDARAFPSAAFVCFLENHDQVANTGRGTRLYHATIPSRWRAMVSLLLLGPSIPMLYQGQETAAAAPFTYFADHDRELAAAVRAGRLDFLTQFPTLASRQTQDALPDPGDESAFRACRIDWTGNARSEDARLLYTDLLALRRSDAVLSGLGTPAVQIATSAPTSDIVLLRYTSGSDDRLVVVNLGRRTTLRMNDPLLAPPRAASWSLLWSSERVTYGGGGVADFPLEERWILQANCAWLFRSEPIAPRA